MKKTFYSLSLMLVLLFPGSVLAQTVTGYVKDNHGQPIAGVVISDGKNFTTTDSLGLYTLDSDPVRRPLVYLSTPVCCELPSENGIASGFYQFLDAGREVNECNFTLKRRQKESDEFVFIPISDPQVKIERHMDRFRAETVPDLRRTADYL